MLQESEIIDGSALDGEGVESNRVSGSDSRPVVQISRFREVASLLRRTDRAGNMALLMPREGHDPYPLRQPKALPPTPSPEVVHSFHDQLLQRSRLPGSGRRRRSFLTPVSWPKPMNRTLGPVGGCAGGVGVMTWLLSESFLTGLGLATVGGAITLAGVALGRSIFTKTRDRGFVGPARI